MKLLITGHACAPDMGSEPGVTWNWALNLAVKNDVWVITQEYWRPEIEAYLAANPVPNLHFVYTGRTGWWGTSRFPSQRSLRFRYLFWQRRVLRLARELDAKHDFDLVHHVSWNTVSAPPLLWRLEKPFVWGPVGGGQTTPKPLLGCYGAGLPAELLRTLRVRLLPILPKVRQAIAKADAVFSVNRETANVLHRAGARDAPLFLDVGVPPHILAEPASERAVNERFTVLWAAVMEPRKGLGLCLEAARLVDVPGVRFLIVGDGPQAAAARRQAQHLGLGDKVEFLGRLPWRELQKLYRTAQIFLFTSIRDSYGTAPLEALAAGTPIICIDHQGADVHLPDGAAVKVPIASPGRVAASVARAIEDLARDPAKLAEMSRAARRYAGTESWDRRAAAMQECYNAILHRRAAAKESAVQ